MPKTKKLRRIVFLVLPVMFLFVFSPIRAAVSQEGWNPDSLKVTNLPDRPVKDILLTFIDWAIIIIGLLGVIVFIYGGFVYLTAQGEPDKIEQAKKIIIYGIVGIVVSILGYVAVKTINDLLVGNAGGGGAPTSGAPGPSTPPTGTGGPMPVAPTMTGQ